MLGLLPLVDATTGSLFLYFNAPSAYLEALRLEPSRRTRWGGHTGRVGDRALERFTWSSREMERGLMTTRSMLSLNFPTPFVMQNVSE